MVVLEARLITESLPSPLMMVIELFILVVVWVMMFLISSSERKELMLDFCLISARYSVMMFLINCWLTVCELVVIELMMPIFIAWKRESKIFWRIVWDWVVKFFISWSICCWFWFIIFNSSAKSWFLMNCSNWLILEFSDWIWSKYSLVRMFWVFFLRKLRLLSIVDIFASRLSSNKWISVILAFISVSSFWFNWLIVKILSW